MGTTLNDTPGANRTHIAFFGKMNSGKSSLVNALANQQISIVSDVCGTTTDLVKKPMEIHGIGPCVLMDTAGFDDTGSLGDSRVAQAKQAARQADLAVLVFAADGSESAQSGIVVDQDKNTQSGTVANENTQGGTVANESTQGGTVADEKRWFDLLRKRDTPVICVVNKTDVNTQSERLAEKIQAEFQRTPLLVSAVTGEGIDDLKNALIATAAGLDSQAERFITGSLVQRDDLILLVMPQDIQAPKGRLILPQVQTLRELLDKKCLTMCVTTDQFEQALEMLKRPPKLIITDSQVFREIYEKKPDESKLTSFSTLFAAYKGDIDYFVEGARTIGALTGQDKVLIAECCTHAPLDEDIGREKLPRLLRKKAGEGLTVEIVSGTDFPQDLSGYRLVIQCGACMFNRKYVISRVDAAKKQHIPMTNYGVAIAYLNGILDKVELT